MIEISCQEQNLSQVPLRKYLKYKSYTLKKVCSIILIFFIIAVLRPEITDLFTKFGKMSPG